MCSVVILSVYHVLKFDIDNSFKMATRGSRLIRSIIEPSLVQFLHLTGEMGHFVLLPVGL